MQACVQICMCACACVYACVHECVFMHVCVCVCVGVVNGCVETRGQPQVLLLRHCLFSTTGSPTGTPRSPVRLG